MTGELGRRGVGPGQVADAGRGSPRLSRLREIWGCDIRPCETFDRHGTPAPETSARALTEGCPGPATSEEPG